MRSHEGRFSIFHRLQQNKCQRVESHLHAYALLGRRGKFCVQRAMTVHIALTVIQTLEDIFRIISLRSIRFHEHHEIYRHISNLTVLIYFTLIRNDSRSKHIVLRNLKEVIESFLYSMTFLHFSISFDGQKLHFSIIFRTVKLNFSIKTAKQITKKCEKELFRSQISDMLTNT